MSSINNNYLLNLINSGQQDLTGVQKSLETAQNNLFGLNSITAGGDSFISTTEAGSAFLANAAQAQSKQETQLTGTKDSNGFFVATGSYANQIQQYQQYISQLEEQIKEYEQLLEQYNTQLETEKANLEATNQKIAATEKELENLENQKAAKEAQYNSVLAQLNQAKANNEDGKQDTVISSLTSKLNGLSTEITTLNTNITVKTGQLQNYQAQACTIQATIADLEEKIDTTETLKTTAEVQKADAQEKLCAAQKAKAAEDARKAAQAQAQAQAQAEAKKETQEKANITDGESLMSQLSDETKGYIKDNNIDLTETYENGNAKYAIAPGDTDGEYHVYEMDENGTRGSSITQAEFGNNNLYNMQDCDDGVNVYTVTDANDDLSDCDYECSTKSYNTASPLSFDLEGDGIKTSDELIQYDIDGDGDLDTINDSADAILVFDADGDGISGEDGSECFGNNTDLDGDGKADGYKDGFEALKALADQEGLVDGVYDTTLDEEDLKVLEEKYGLQIKTDGYNSEGSSLFEAGITEINLATTDETTLHENFDGKSNDIMTQEGATFVVNGEEREYADIWHAMKDE